MRRTRLLAITFIITSLLFSITSCSSDSSTDSLLSSETSSMANGENNEVEEVQVVSEVGVDVLDYEDHSFACFFGCASWEEAKEQCENMGGYLAVITSQEENDALFAFTRYCGYDNVYIGYSDSEEEGNWQWVNGEESSFTNWNDGEPNAFTENEDYAVFADTGAWCDGEYTPRIENGLVAFICEWDNSITGTANLTANDVQEILTARAQAETDAQVAQVAAQAEASRVAAYGSYLSILESLEYDIITYESYMESMLTTCAMYDVTGDGVEDLIILKQDDPESVGYHAARLVVYSYNSNLASASVVLEIGNYSSQGGGGSDSFIAVSNSGKLIVCDCPSGGFLEENMTVYSFDGTQLVTELSLRYSEDLSGEYSDPQIYVNDNQVSRDSFNSNEAEIINSIAVMTHTNGSFWSPNYEEYDDSHEIVSSYQCVGMSYDDMHALLTQNASVESTEPYVQGNMIGVLVESGSPRADTEGNPPELRYAMTCEEMGIDFYSYDDYSARHLLDYCSYGSITYDEFEEAVGDLVDEGCTTIVLACSQSTFDSIGSNGLRRLQARYPSIEFLT